MADDPRFEAMVGAFPRDEAYWAALAEMAHKRTVAILWNGNQHYGSFLVEADPPIDAVVPGETDRPLSKDATTIPYLALIELWQSSLKDLRPIVDRLRKAHNCRPIIVGTPPPIADETVIRKALETHCHDKRSTFFGVDPYATKLTPREVVYKLWVTIQHALAKLAEEHGAPFLPVPAEAQDEHGFLREEYAQSLDFTHANARYGALMRDHIAAFKWR